MHWIDASIFIFYLVLLMGIGLYFLRKNKTEEDYFISSRSMSGWHIGISVVATDVGGGFSIGLGGLGFLMGISGSWMLFTGLLGAWLSAVLLIPKIYTLGVSSKFLTFPQVFGHFYGKKVAFLAGIISMVGYLGFTSSQILAGAKLASASFVDLNFTTALLVMGLVTVLYTGFGGIKAVIYTDTIQWVVLMGGLAFIGLPLAYLSVGGYEEMVRVLPAEYFSLGNVKWQSLVNWAITIIPIWFVGMTLYQRIYASRSERDAKKAWFIAGVFEWPIMAFMGVLLGLMARVAAEQGMFASQGFAEVSSVDPEMGLPLLLRNILPVGMMGLMMSVYFSAILSTADSCLMAASGNLQSDLFGAKGKTLIPKISSIRLSQIFTLLLGAVAILLASAMENVLSLMLYSYAFMVSGLLVPLIAAVFFKKRKTLPALISMISGGLVTVVLSSSGWSLPLGLDANVFGISTSFLSFVFVDFIKK